MERPLLFRRLPGLAGNIEWMPLGEFPTPVQRMDGLCSAERLNDFYVKRDDMSSPFYGGNKVRKLEFLLARIKALGHDTMTTFGAAGSNHVVATVIHGERVGIKTIAVLNPQPNAAYVRKNLLLDHKHGADFIALPSIFLMPVGLLRAMARGFDPKRMKFPYPIWFGGTTVRGCLGYVECALEIKRQVDEGLLPEPEFIFATYGSGGTSAGLMIGVRLAGMNSRVVSVRVVEKVFCNRYMLASNVNRTQEFIRPFCPEVHLPRLHPREIILMDDFAGPQYAEFTPEGIAAVREARELDGLKLDGTYTGKTLAGALHFIHRHGLERRSCLFVDTFNSVDLYKTVKDIDYHVLPDAFHGYFESPLQEEEMGMEVLY